MDYFNKFVKASPEKTLREYNTKKDVYWKGAGEQLALQLFKQAASRVPAYKKFLKRRKINPSKIKTIEDFAKVPLTDKENYINKHKLNDLCWDGKISNSYFLSASSGSTGVPNFWPRSDEQTFQGASISELIYKEYFDTDEKTTLYIVAFAMGMWIAGTYMATSTEWVAQKGHPIAIATPGLNREEIIRLVKMGDKYYDQVVLVGYPPFVKDVIDFGVSQKLDWKKINIKFIFSGEAITERWRDYLADRVGSRNILKDFVNIYGSADVGLVAHETALTTFIRRQALGDKKLLNELFRADRAPSVYQYNPHIRYFEKVGGYLVISAPSGLPLVRYDTKDEGDILYFGEAEKTLRDSGIDIAKSLKKYKVDNLLWRLPMVYLFGRGKFSTTIYGITIFPEYVKFTLDSQRLSGILTGKYIISTEETKSHDQTLHLRVELKENQKSSRKLASLVKETFVRELTKVSSEYKHLLKSMGSKVYPKIHLSSYGDPEYFPRGVIKKNA